MTEIRMKLLLVEDDQNLGQLLQEYLNAKEYDTDLAKNGQEGLEFFGKKEYDLCILDVMMPIMDGYSLAKKIRSTNAQIPLIFLTAKSMKEDTIEGFQSGADDYMTKPFSMEELLYRIKAILKRSSFDEENDALVNYKLGRYDFDPNSQVLNENGKQHKLTSKENQLLKILCQNMNQTVQRDVALKLIWGDDTYFNARSMDVYISKLRKQLKLEEDIEILNIHGKGFKLVFKNH